MRCDDPEPPENGEVIIHGNSAGDTLTYKCDIGYNLVGEATATCTEVKPGKMAFEPKKTPKCKGMLNTIAKLLITCS